MIWIQLCLTQSFWPESYGIFVSFSFSQVFQAQFQELKITAISRVDKNSYPRGVRLLAKENFSPPAIGSLPSHFSNPTVDINITAFLCGVSAQVHLSQRAAGRLTHSGLSYGMWFFLTCQRKGAGWPPQHPTFGSRGGVPGLSMSCSWAHLATSLCWCFSFGPGPCGWRRRSAMCFCRC